jgi:hypothetical protein
MSSARLVRAARNPSRARWCNGFGGCTVRAVHCPAFDPPAFAAFLLAGRCPAALHGLPPGRPAALHAGRGPVALAGDQAGEQAALHGGAGHPAGEQAGQQDGS